MEKVWFKPGEDFPLAAYIREEVFVKEQGYTMEEEFDDLDEKAYHLVLLDGEKPVATARLLNLGNNEFKPGRIAVLKEYRGKNIGAELLTAVLEKAKELGGKTFHIGAQTYAVGFYEKFGFKAYGEEYMDGRIPHIDMISKI